MPDGENDRNGHPCPMVVGADIKTDKDYYAGVGFVFGEGIRIIFTDNKGEIVKEEKI